MSRRRPLLAAGFAVALALAAPVAHAGRPCDVEPLTVQAVQTSLLLAARTAERLDASGAQVVLLARAGQDLSRWGLRWSHAGWAYKAAGGHWRVLHKLNTCGSDRGDLWRQGLGEFFLDGTHQHRAAWVVPTPELQRRLLPLLADDARATALQHAPYNMVAYPWSLRYQQSNQWALETLAMAAEPRADTREQAQAWLRLQGYRPPVLRVPALMRLGASVANGHIAFDDHPNGERFAGRIATVTVDSMFAWLTSRGLATPVEEQW